MSQAGFCAWSSAPFVQGDCQEGRRGKLGFGQGRVGREPWGSSCHPGPGEQAGGQDQKEGSRSGGLSGV